MKENYDFGDGKRGAVVKNPPSKTRITIRLDQDIIAFFKEQVHEAGGGNYQSLLNQALREHMKQQQEPLENILRRVLREELQLVG